MVGHTGYTSPTGLSDVLPPILQGVRLIWKKGIPEAEHVVAFPPLEGLPIVDGFDSADDILRMLDGINKGDDLLPLLCHEISNFIHLDFCYSYN